MSGAMDVLNKLKAGFSMAVPASATVRAQIATSELVHLSGTAFQPKFVDAVLARPDRTANAIVTLSGDTGRKDGWLLGYSLGDLLRKTVRDHRIIDPRPFQSAGEERIVDFVYFFLGQPQPWQVESQSLGAAGLPCRVTIQGSDLLADPQRRIFYRTGLFWEGDRAVIVKGGYSGRALVDPLDTAMSKPFA